jgi:glycosyltransferase involved in cell wall biosynthesis
MMLNMPRISIITPVYNASAFLGRCLDSLASMTFRDFEVIAVDDGSDDDSWSVIEDFARRDHRFSRSFQVPHCGLGPARNRGLEIARGEFVAFVDSDDYVDPDYCGIPYALACERQADLVCFGSWWVYPEREDLHQHDYEDGMSPQEALLSITPMVWDKLYRRDFLQSRHLGFHPIYHEDEVFTPSLMAHSPRTIMLKRPLYYYVRREGSISGLRVNQNSVDVLKAFRLVIDQSLAIPEFRHELEFYAVRFLVRSASSWAACQENWSVDCQRSAKLLLDAIDNPSSDNPYLLRPSPPKGRFARYPGDLITHSIPTSGMPRSVLKFVEGRLLSKNSAASTV